MEEKIRRAQCCLKTCDKNEKERKLNLCERVSHDIQSPFHFKMSKLKNVVASRIEKFSSGCHGSITVQRAITTAVSSAHPVVMENSRVQSIVTLLAFRATSVARLMAESFTISGTSYRKGEQW